MIQKVDNQTFNVRAIVILIRHDHQMAVTKTINRCIVGVVLESQDLFDVLDFDVFHDGLMGRVSDIEQFAPQREDTVVVTSNDTQSGYSQSLGGISFGKDERAAFSVAASRIVCIF